MKNLFIYGCSFGKFGCVTPGKEIKWDDKFSFGDILSEMLGYTLINRSKPGGCNYQIFKNIKNDIQKNRHKSDDLVFVQWSYIDRGYSPYSDNTLMPFFLNEESKLYYKYYYSDNQNFCKVAGYNYFIKNILKCKYYFSFIDKISVLRQADEFIFSVIDSEKNYLKYNNRNFLESIDGPNNFFDDGHLSRLGHLNMAKMIKFCLSEKLTDSP